MLCLELLTNQSSACFLISIHYVYEFLADAFFKVSKLNVQTVNIVTINDLIIMCYEDRESKVPPHITLSAFQVFKLG